MSIEANLPSERPYFLRIATWRPNSKARKNAASEARSSDDKVQIFEGKEGRKEWRRVSDDCALPLPGEDARRSGREGEERRPTMMMSEKSALLL